ncbi:MAG: DUF5694 domain-containing protein [Pseudomonadota bacterium]
MRVIAVTALLAGLAACSTVDTASTEPAATKSNTVKVMVIGTYHFQASETDLIAVQPEDVRSPEHQAELQQIADALSTFSPTVIATERVTKAPDYIDEGFVAFDEQQYEISQHERVQLAYRLARTANVNRVYGIDEQPDDNEPDYFPFSDLMAHAQNTGQIESLQAMLGTVQGEVEQRMAKMGSMHIAEALLETNNGFLSSPDFYFKILEYDTGEAQPAATLNGYWFMRNAKIFSKLLDVTEPGDRVIVVFGAGHKYWLELLAEQTPGVELVKPDTYLETALRDRVR